MNRVGLGLRAVKAGAVLVGVTADAGEPRLVVSQVVATAGEGDRLSMEPYRAAAEAVAEGRTLAEAAALVAEGRERQNRIATRAMADVAHSLRGAGHEPVVAALLVNRAGWITDLLEYSLSWTEHVPVAEPLAVRDALRFAIGQAGLALTEIDEKSLPDLAPAQIGMPPDALDAALAALGASVGRPWRKEQKLACLAAWSALTAKISA
jgi:hypothetical protein